MRRLASKRTAFSAATPSQASKRPSTCDASDGVTPAIITNPRATNRSIAATSSRDVNAAATGIAATTRANTAASRAVKPPVWAALRLSIGTTNRPSNSPTASALKARSSAACTISPCSTANNDTGINRRGPSRNRPTSPTVCKCTSLSPPKPVVRIATASTMVRKPPTRAPCGSISGRPPRSRATSVVVPPMSLTKASAAPVNHRAPTILAAGPDRMVSIGRSRTIAAEINAPSPRTTIKGAVIPTASKCRSQAATRRSIIPISRAFNTAVNARLGPFNWADNSCEQVTGRPVTRRTRSRAAISWPGLRVPKRAATAKPMT